MKGFLATFGVVLGVMIVTACNVGDESSTPTPTPDGWIEPPTLTPTPTPTSAPVATQPGDSVMSRGDWRLTPTPTPTRTGRVTTIPTLIPTPVPTPEFKPEFVELVDLLWDPEPTRSWIYFDENVRRDVLKFMTQCSHRRVGNWKVDANGIRKLDADFFKFASFGVPTGIWLERYGQIFNPRLRTEVSLMWGMAEIGFELWCLKFERGADVSQLDTYTILILSNKVLEVEETLDIQTYPDGVALKFDKLAEIPAIQVYPAGPRPQVHMNYTFWSLGYTPKRRVW